MNRNMSGAVTIMVAITFWILSGPSAWSANLVQAEVNGAALADGIDYERALSSIETRGNIPLIIRLNVPGYSPEIADNVQAANAQQVAITQVQDNVLARLGSANVSNVKQFRYIPHMALTVDGPQALAALYADPDVIYIEEDEAVPPILTDSVPLVRAHFAHTLFYTGRNQNVAVLDTGVDRTHDDLSGRVISEACYSTNSSSQGVSSLCPGGGESSTASGSGVNCSSTISGCDHGTHVAGIVAAVAPEANIVAIQVFSRQTDSGSNTPCSNAGRTSPCTLSFSSDQIAALERVVDIRTSSRIVAVNMSLGGGQFTSTCNTDSRKTAIDVLRSFGIPTVIAAGNNGFRNAVSRPGCISSAITVGATDKDDDVASYSNLSSFTDLLAPGSSINSTVPGDITQAKNGTSMAAPHVAGAISIMKHVNSSMSVNTIESFLLTSGPLISDQRSNGTISKRRLDVYSTICRQITCDADDYRSLVIGSALSGTINPSTDRDHYFFNGTSGTVLNVAMDRTSGTLDSFLMIYDPDGLLVSTNDNGGSDKNSLINGYTLRKTGRYMIVARGLRTTGTYTIKVSRQVKVYNPVPYISSISPSSATGSFAASDFWVRINGRNFTPESTTYWNGLRRYRYYSSPNLIWIRVRGSDLYSPWPRTAQITVRNPTPGGGTSKIAYFRINFPFLGESELVQPAPDTTISTGISTTFTISWTRPLSITSPITDSAPITSTSWRIMQNMDLRLRDQTGKIAAWIRVYENKINGQDASVYRLLNSGETLVTEDSQALAEGRPGEDRTLVLTDTVQLLLAHSKFSGSGQTAIMTPTVIFGPKAIGTYNIEFRVDGPNGEVQDDDVLGKINIVPAECPTAVAAVALVGTQESMVGDPQFYTADATLVSVGADQAATYTWIPEPISGQGSAGAFYRWENAGEKLVSVQVEVCESFEAAQQAVQVYTTANSPDLAISTSGPPVAVSGKPITYTLTITNSGRMTATNLFVSNTLPENATYIGGGTPAGNGISWQIASLAGYGGVIEKSFTVSATEAISNSTYGVTADGGSSASGRNTASTHIVDAMATLAPLADDNISYTVASGIQTEIQIPVGSVFATTQVGFEEQSDPAHPLPPNLAYRDLAFRLSGYADNRSAPELQLSENISVTIRTSDSLTTGAAVDEVSLYALDSDQWIEVATCSETATPNQVTCLAETPRLTDFVLASQAEDIASENVFLPIISR